MKRPSAFLIAAVSFLSLVVFPGSLSAQSRKTSNSPMAKKFDEFGALSHCSLTARLDNFAIFLDQTAEQQGYILVYAPPVNGVAERVLTGLRDYLINTRGIAEDRIQTIYAGRNNVLSELKVQLWFAPSGVLAPQPENFRSQPQSFKGKLYEYDAWDDIPFGEPEGEGIFMSVSAEALLDVLQHQSRSVVYVIGYNGEESAPRAWQRVAQREIDNLKKSGVESSRIKLLYGGDVKETKVQVWVQTSTDPPPVKVTRTERIPSKLIQVGDYGSQELAYKDYERHAFERLVEALRAFPTLRACLIVKVADTTNQIVEEEMPINSLAPVYEVYGEFEPAPDSVDLLKLVDKWKNDLRALDIREDRLVVLFSKALPDYSDSLESWVIPPGMALPDPDANVNH